MPTITTVIQHYSGSSSQCKMGRKRKKIYDGWNGNEEERKGRSKTDDMFGTQKNVPQYTVYRKMYV